MSSTTETRTVVEQIVDNADERELWIVGREFERPPYFHAGKGGDTRLARALRVCVEGRITPNSDGSYTVEGSEHRTYRVEHSCSCPQSQKASSKYCYHFVAVCVYVEWQRRLRPVAPVELGTLRPGTLPRPPVTVDERLARTMTALDTMNDAAAAVRLGTMRDATALQTHHTPQEARMAADEYIPEPDIDDAPTAILEAVGADALPVPQEDGYDVTQEELMASEDEDASIPEPEGVEAPVAMLDRAERREERKEGHRPQPGTARLPSLALPRRSIQAIIADLSRPLPEACVASKTQGGQAIPFLHWQTVARVLDAYAPGWDGQVMRVDQVGTTCAITYRLTIPCLEGDVSREATGQEDADVKGYGDATSNAEAMAMKRAAAKFGVGAWLYDKDATAPALAAHLKEEKTRHLATLGARLDALGRDRQRTLAWLKEQTGATRTSDIPLGAIRALLTHLSSVEETP